MAVKRNPMTDAILNIKRDFDELHQMANDSRAIPIGQEKVDRKTALKRFQDLSLQERQAWLADPDRREQIIKLIRSGK